jgi:hypothetical protein
VIAMDLLNQVTSDINDLMGVKNARRTRQ